MKKIVVILSCFVVLTGICCFAGEPSRAAGRLCSYRITSRGLRVGELKTAISPVSRPDGRAFRFESNLAINANLLFFKVAKSSHEQALVTEHGTLSYHRQGQENGSESSVDAHLEGGRFHFRISENGAARSFEVARGSYDFTTMDCPETTMKHEGETVELRILDLEHAKVVTRKFHWVKSEEIEVGGRQLLCKVVDFSDPNNNCRRWVGFDERGVIITRQEGKGKSGSYLLRMVALNDAPA